MVVNYVSEDLAEALELVPGERVIDVACGSGNGAIAAARRTMGGVVGADYVPALLDRGRERAAAERVDLRRDVRAGPAEGRGRAFRSTDHYIEYFREYFQVIATRA